MAAPKHADLKVQTDDQLATSLQELKREQFNLRFQAATGQLEKPGRVREVRRTIARIKTLQSVRKPAAAAANVQAGVAGGTNVAGSAGREA